MAEFEHFEIELTFTQPLLRIDGKETEQMTQSDVIYFGTWLKGDKGDEGAQGLQGERGAQGPQGKIGLHPVLPAEHGIQKNGTDLGSFTLNQPENETIDIPVPTKTSDIENDSGFITQDDVLAYKAFPSSWHTSGLMAALIQDINNDPSATEGMSYMSTVSFTDLPSGMLQGELQLDIMSSSNIGKVIKFTLTSEDVVPYHWEYTSAYGRAGQWRGFVVESQIPQEP